VVSAARPYRLPPRPAGDAAVRTGDVGFGNLQVKHRLAFGLVFGFDDLAGLVLINGPQARALAGGFIH